MSGLGNIAAVAPAIPLLIGFVLPILLRLSPRISARFAWLGSAGALLVVGLAIASRLMTTIGSSQPFASHPAAFPSIPLRMDALGAVMLATISVIGFVVANFAIRYLDRDPAQRSFSIWLSYTFAAILTMPLASNLVFFFLAWVMSSHGLHQLLMLYPERPGARMAARKKFLVSRIGDVFLASAFALILFQWGSLDFDVIFARAAADAAAGRDALLPVITLLLVLGAITKSAQFPLHTWLPDTMEVPTPVSALMHAGIINAGGFLLIRMSPLFALETAALTPLAILGAFSAMAGSLIMLTQNDVKRKLAYSTISQMGFMMLQCGIGAFGAAMLHLVGHSFYKAHAFLSAGSWVDPNAASGMTLRPRTPISMTTLWVALFLGFVITGGAVWVMGVDVDSKPGGWVLLSILALAISQAVVIWKRLTGSAVFRPKRIGILIMSATGLALFYLAAVSFLDSLLGETIGRPILEIADPRSLIGLLLVAMFSTSFMVQTYRPGARSGPYWTRLYVLLRNGFYLGDLQNRWVSRIWPITETSAKPAP